MRKGERVRLPYRIGRQLVAQAYGCRPWDVDEWPVSEYMDAAAMLGLI